MSAVEVLRQARELIADKSRWTQNAAARDASGIYTSPRNESAVCWCAQGAILNKCDWDSRFQPIDLLDNACIALFDGLAVEVNDGLKVRGDAASHAAILSAFDRAIVDAEAANA